MPPSMGSVEIVIDLLLWGKAILSRVETQLAALIVIRHGEWRVHRGSAGARSSAFAIICGTAVTHNEERDIV